MIVVHIFCHKYNFVLVVKISFNRFIYIAFMCEIMIVNKASCDNIHSLIDIIMYKCIIIIILA